MNCRFCNSPITFVKTGQRIFNCCAPCTKSNGLVKVENFIKGYIICFKIKNQSDEMWQIRYSDLIGNTIIEKGAHSYQYDIDGEPLYNYHTTLTIPGDIFTPINCKQRLKICLTFS